MLPRIPAFVALLCCALSSAAFGQHLLLVKNGDKKPEVVVGARGMAPLVVRDGKRVVAEGYRFGMVDGGSYLYAFVSMRNVQAKTSGLSIDGSQALNKKFHFNCDLESPYNLENVYIVLLMNTSDAGKSIFLFEVGDLEAREIKPVNLTVPLSVELGEGRYTLHMFSGGRELFHSRMPFGALDVALNKVVRDKIQGLSDANAQPLLGPAPEYPKALRKKKVEGSALLSITIDQKGNVMDPSVAEASAPEFGAAAMEVIKQWRFLPKVVAGKPVSSKVKIPFSFTLPKKS